MINGLGRIIGLVGPDTKIVPGHGPIVKRDAVIAHRDMILGVRDKISKMVQQGKSQEEVAAAKPQAEYDARIKEIATTGDRFVGQVYAELKPAAK
jgi:glyoxylase-like metal-dependent hydrolase (beta-lactamase superfamily II)